MSTALLIIDVQNGILVDTCSEARLPAVEAHLEGVIDRLAALRDKARAAGVPVVVVQHDGPEGDSLAIGTPGWEVVDALKPGPGDVHVNKTACDAFYETDLIERLTERGVDHLTVGGCLTQFCVDTTVRRAISLGFDVTLIADGHSTGDFGGLTQQQIVDHHNTTLDWFEAGAARVRVRPASEIGF